MKNAFYFILKALFILKIFISKFLSSLFSHVEKTAWLEMMKNAFYFILKGLFVLKIFKFLTWLIGHVEKMAWLEK